MFEASEYEQRSWASEDERLVRFVRGPGPFEGEPIFTEALYAVAMQGFADASFGSVEYGSAYDVFRGPFNVETLEDVPTLTEDERDILEEYRGAILRHDSQGFVYLSLYNTDSELDAVVSEIEAEEAGEDDV